MRGNSGYRMGQQRIVLLVVLWIVFVMVGFGLVWLGYALGKRQPSDGEDATATAAALASPLLPSVPVSILPTYTPLPMATPTPTLAPVMPTSPPARIETGANGLNIRSGPGLTFSILAHVDPGLTFMVTGYYADWWQIDYNGTPGWANDSVVTAYDTDGVPEVPNPPPSPVPT